MSFLRPTNDIVSRHRRGEFASGPVVIVGSSHSAMTALQRLRAVHSAPGTVPLEAVVIQRSPARIMYESLALARARSVSGRERIADELMDVCPSTGIVFRDSGLRHASRDLYYALWAGELPRALLVQSPTDATRIEFLERASVIVQAVGYVPNYPVISIAGRANPDRNVGVLSAAPNGAALVDGQPVRELSVLRVGQTPPELRDRSEYGRNLYRDLRRRLSAL